MSSINPKLPTLVVCLTVLTCSANALATSLSSYFQEPLAPVLALSPDGAYLAYEAPPIDRRPARVVIRNVDTPDAQVELPLVVDKGKFPPDRVEFLGWSSARRLVIGTRNGRVFSLDENAHNERDCSQVFNRDKTQGPADTAENVINDDYLKKLAQFRFHVAALPVGEPNVAIVEVDRLTVGSIEQPTGLLRFDAVLGKMTMIHESAAWNSSGRYLYDRFGHARILIGPVGSNWQKYRISTAPEGWSNWEDLSEFLPQGGFKFERPSDRQLARFSVPIGFGSGEDDLLIASNTEGERFQIFKVNTKTKEKSLLAVDAGDFDAYAPGPVSRKSHLLYDRLTGRWIGLRVLSIEAATVWFDPEFSALQSRLEDDFPGRTVAILSWNDARSRFVVLVSDDSDAGRLFVVDAAKPDLPLELFKRMPRLDTEDLGPTQPFAFRTASADILSGYLTLPHNTWSLPAPLVLIVNDRDGDRAMPGYNPVAQALAKLGYAVACLNDRGSASIGIGHAQLRRGPDEESRDLHNYVDWLSARVAIDSQRVAVLGEGPGGIVAAQAAAVIPGQFLCAVAVSGEAEGTLPEGLAGGNLALLVAGAKDSAKPYTVAGYRTEEVKLPRDYSALNASERADMIQKIGDFLEDHGMPAKRPKKKWFWQ